MNCTSVDQFLLLVISCAEPGIDIISVPHTIFESQSDVTYIRASNPLTVNNQLYQSKMSRTRKWTVHEARAEQKWFTHHGPTNMDPNKIKKMGAGRNNWGRPGDELDDEYNFFGVSNRRNSNHQMNEAAMKTLNDDLEKNIL